MNRYAAHGIALDAALNGKRVLVLTPIGRMIRDAMDEMLRVLERYDPDTYEVRRAKGNESISFLSGGCVRFQSAQSNLRGQSADVVFLDVDVDRQISRDHLNDVHVIIQPHGEIVRA